MKMFRIQILTALSLKVDQTIVNRTVAKVSKEEIVFRVGATFRNENNSLPNDYDCWTQQG